MYLFHKTMYNKTIIEFGFCDIRNNQGLGKCNQPRPPALAENTCLDPDYSGYHKNLIQLLFAITLVITNRTPAEWSSDFVITRKITDRTGLHSVLLPLPIKVEVSVFLSKVVGKTKLNETRTWNFSFNVVRKLKTEMES